MTTDRSRRMRIARWGNSLTVSIPGTLAEQAGLAEGDEVEASVIRGVLVLRRSDADSDLSRLVAAITPESRHDETDWDEARGAEAW
jgi:antitoxin component of MazEF toxin-antitoxin module